MPTASERRQLRVISQDLRGASARVLSRTMLAITANLVERTPVDTGWARANWVPAVGRPFREPVGSRDSVTSAAQEAGIAAVATYRDPSQGNLYVTNNVPYIERLNDGYSAQAPAGFVQAAIADGIALVESADRVLNP